MKRFAPLIILASAGLLTASPAAGQRPGDQGKTRRTDLYGDPLPEGAIARLGTIRLRHCSEVNSVIFTLDGKSLIAADAAYGSDGIDHHIRIYDPTTGAPVRSFLGHPSGDEQLALSPDGKLLAGIGGAHSVCLWDMATGRLLREFGAHAVGEVSNLIHLAFSPDGKTLTTVGGASGIQFWDVATGERVRRLDCMEHGWHVAYSPDGKLLAAGGWEGLQLWDVATGKIVWQIKSAAGIHAAAFSPDGKTLAVGDEAGSVLLVAPADGKEVRRWQAHAEINKNNRSTRCVAFSPDGKTLASGGDDGLIYLWDPLTGKKTRELCGHLGTVWSVAFSPDGRTLASGSYDRTVRLWDVATGRERPAFAAHGGPIWCVAFSPDGKSLASGGKDRTVRLWDSERGEQLHVLDDYRHRVTALTYSPDGKLFASADRSGDIRLRESANGKLIRSLNSHGDDLLAFLPDGRTLASAGSGTSLRVWDVATGNERLPVPTGSALKWMNSRAFSADGKLLACQGYDKTFYVLDWSAGREVCRLAPSKDDIRCMAFAPDGQRLASGGEDGAIRLWSAKEGNELFAWYTRDHGTVWAMAFSPDGRLLACAGKSDTAVALWEAATGKELHRFVGHRAWIEALAFSPDGRWLASGSQDFTVLMWDVPAALGKDIVGPSDVERCWKDLAADDARVAYRAVWGLASVPAKSVPMLRERVRPVPRVTADRIDRLIADLDDDDFAVRTKATAALRELGELAEPALRKVFHDTQSAEVRRRADDLISRVAAPIPPAEQLRLLRALAALEEIGTPDARRVLESLVKGAPEARLTREAKAALERLTRRVGGDGSK
jgi:WD40 repeat protein